VSRHLDEARLLTVLLTEVAPHAHRLCSPRPRCGYANRTHTAPKCPLLEAAYRSGTSPEYRRRIRSSSSSVSPRPTVSRERSSAPAMKAIRSRRLSSRRRRALPVDWRGCSFTPTFSPFVAHATTGFVASSAEPDRDAPSAEGGDEVPRARFLEVASEVNHVGRQGRHVDGSLHAPVARGELRRHHRRHGRGIAQRCPDGVVAGISRGYVFHRTDVLIAHNTRRALLA